MEGGLRMIVWQPILPSEAFCSYKYRSCVDPYDGNLVVQSLECANIASVMELMEIVPCPILVLLFHFPARDKVVCRWGATSFPVESSHTLLSRVSKRVS